MNSQKGVAHILVLIILVLGLAAGLYLVQHPQIFKPKAYDRLGRGSISAPIVTCQTDSECGEGMRCQVPSCANSDPEQICSEASDKAKCFAQVEQKAKQRCAGRCVKATSTPKVGNIFMQDITAVGIGSPALYTTDPARTAGNIALALVDAGRNEEAKQVISDHINALGSDPNSALGAYDMGLAAHLIGRDDLVMNKVIDVINNTNLTPRSGVACDTGAEVDAWNAALLALAANFYSDDPRAGGWETTAKALASHALSPDNVGRNYFLDNHDAHPNVHYAFGAAIGELGMGALTYMIVGKPVPNEFRSNVSNVAAAHRAYYDQSNYQLQGAKDCRSGTPVFTNGRDDWGADATWGSSGLVYAGYPMPPYSFSSPVYPRGSSLYYLLYSIYNKRFLIATYLNNPSLIPKPTP